MIRVIGLGGQASVEAFAEHLSGSTIVARAAEPALAWLDGRFQLAQSFDALFDELRPEEILPQIVRQFSDLLTTNRDTVYLVPGSAFIGDVTVGALASADLADVEIVAGHLTPERLSFHLQIVDALNLAVAEDAWPFDAGLAPLDPAASVLVTNLRGKSVVDLALSRVGRVYSSDIAQPDGGEVFIEAVDPLSGMPSMSALEHIVARLRRPDGCPWDQEQTPSSLIPMTIEEIDELREAIEAADAENQAEEMGDVLLHLMLMAQMAREADRFNFGDVVRVVAEKMIRRHPHVFAGLEVSSIDDIMDNWNAIKAAEKSGGDPGMLEGRT